MPASLSLHLDYQHVNPCQAKKWWTVRIVATNRTPWMWRLVPVCCCLRAEQRFQERPDRGSPLATFSTFIANAVPEEALRK